MRALVFTRPGTVEVLDVPEPDVAPDEVLLDVLLAGICGSELHGISSAGFRTPPLVMGHELVGLAPDGRRVTVNPLVACGACDRCAQGRENLCRSRALLGVHRAGAFAERLAVPVRNVHFLPDALATEAAALVEPLANAVHAWALADRPVGASVAVIGAGAIGLVCAQTALAEGAARVTVVDPSAERQALASKLGAHTVGPELLDEFDVVFDAVGLPATHQASVARLVPGGTAVWLGLMSPEAAFDGQALVRQEQTVRGSFAYTDAEFDEAVQLAERLDLGWADTFPLESGATIFTELMNGRADVVKALLAPGA